jgi:thioredoxin-like negative regulator of GroEL
MLLNIRQLMDDAKRYEVVRELHWSDGVKCPACDWQAANSAMEKAHTRAPDDDRITERYLLTLERSGSPEKARALLQTLPQTWRWLQLAGDLAQRMGDQAAAVQCYTAALAHLEEKLDTDASAFAANLKAVLILKRDSATGDA